MFRMLTIALLLCSSVFAIPFYVKQEKVQLPGREIEVRVQGTSAPLHFTVFKVKNPEIFLAEQSNIHRLKIENTELRAKLNQAIEIASATDKPEIYGETAKDRQLPFTFIRYFKKEVKQSGTSFDGYYSVPLGIKESGVYLVETRQENFITYNLVVCSDLALIVRRSAGKAVVYAVDRKWGKPRANVDIRLYRRGKILVQGKTDKEGVFASPIAYFPSITIMANDGENFSAGDPSFFPSIVDSYKTYIFTERPLYLPGEKVYFKGIIRRFDGEYSVPGAKKLEYKALDARKNEIKKGNLELNKEGTFSGSFDLPKNQSLGNCFLQVKYGRRWFQTEFRVEKFQKPKFSVSVKPEKKAMVAGGKARYTISGRYYSGGKLEKAKIRYRLSRSRFYQPLFHNVGLAGFYSESEYKSFQPEMIASGEAKVKNGICQLEFDSARSDSSYHLRLSVFVVDLSRNTASGSGSVTVSPANVKIDMTTNKELYSIEEQIQIKIKAVDITNAPVATDFQVKLTRKGRTYPKGGAAVLPGELAELDHFTNVPPKVFFTDSGKTGKEGETIIEVPAALAGEIDVELSAKDAAGNHTQVVKTVWVENGKEPVLYSGRSIHVITDKKAYQAGDIAQIMVVLPMKKVTPLLTIEGSDLLSYHLEYFSGNTYTLKVPITEKMTPNVYFKAGAVYKNGFIEAQKMLVVPPIDKMLNVTVTTDKKFYGPGDKAQLAIAAVDHRGNPVATDLALGVVDASIYALAPDANAPLHRFFYPLRRSNVGGGSTALFLSYDYARRTERIIIMRKPVVKDAKKEMAMRPDRSERSDGAFEDEESAEEETTGEAPAPVEAPRSEPMRRMAESRPSPKKKDKGTAKTEAPVSERKLFRNTAAWFAHVRTDATGKGQVEFVWPDNLSNWRITAIAVDEKTRIAKVIVKTKTRKPLAVTVNNPTFLVEGDRIDLPLSARNATGKEAEITMSLKYSPGLKADSVKFSGKVQHDQRFRKNVSLKAISAEEAWSSVTVRSGEYQDAELRKFPVIAHGIRQSKGSAGTLLLKSNELPAADFELPDNVTHGQLAVRITPGYLAAVQDAVQMLAEYPYGCTEQTMSRFMPTLVAAAVCKNLGVKSQFSKKQLQEYIDAGLARLYQLQHEDGGWGWWERDGSHVMMSAYVLSGLGRAHQLGYKVKKNSFKRAAKFLTAKLNDSSLSYNEKAYIAYALSVFNLMPAKKIDKIFDDENRLKADPYTLALVALSLKKSGRDAEAQYMAKEIFKQARPAGDANLYWGNLDGCRWDKDAIEVTAMATRALIEITPKHKGIPLALDWLMSQRQGQGWRSTKDTAEAVLTLCTWLETRKNNTQSQKARVTVNGFSQEVELSDKTASLIFEQAKLKTGPNKVTIDCAESGQYYYTAYLQFFTKELPIRAASSGFEVKRSYHLLHAVKSGNSMKYQPQQMPNKLKAGDLVMVTLTVNNHRDYDFVMVEDGIPAGSKTETKDRNIDVAGIGKDTQWAHREFHFEKAVFFFTRLPRGSHTIHYFFRPTHSGNFHALPARASLMYYPEIRGNSVETIFEVE